MSDAPHAPVSALPPDVDTLVLGGGIAGLAYAHALGADADVLLLEAAPRAGGLIRTERAQLREGALHFECGPEALQDNAPETRALLAELGLAAAPAAPDAQRRFVLRAGRLVALPLSPQAFLASPLLSIGGRLRALGEPWRDARTALDGSVADFVRHRLGAEMLERIVDPFVTGVVAGDAEQISLRAAFPQVHALVAEHGSLWRGMRARRHAARSAGADAGHAGRARGVPSLVSFHGGLQALPEALAAVLGDRLRLGVRVTALRLERGAASAMPVNAPAATACWCAETVRAGAGADDVAGVASRTGSVRARRVVVALPVGASARLLQPLSAELGAALGSMVRESVVSIAHAWRREDVAHALDGFGYLVAAAEKRLHLGTLFSSTIRPERAPPDLVLLRTLLGGARHERMVEWPDEELLAVLKDDVSPLLGLRGEPRFTDIARWRGALPRYDLQQPQRQERIDALLAGLPGLFVIGNHRRGISVNALIEGSRALARAHRAAQAPRSA